MRRLLVVVVAGGVLGYGAYVLFGLPSRAALRALTTTNPFPTALMRQRAREAAARKKTARTLQTWVPLSRVSRSLIQAVISSEDQRFFGHGGIDWAAIKESAETNVKRRQAVRGGSTLTQQLAKNLYFGTEKSLTRKLREAIVTRWLEDDLSKVRILTLYLNVIEWGDGVYGCEEAAEAWFGKTCAGLDVDEAAGLAGMIPNPRRINPTTDPVRYARSKRRVLWLMSHAGYIEKSVAGLGATLPEPEPEPESEAPANDEEPPPVR